LGGASRGVSGKGGNMDHQGKEGYAFECPKGTKKEKTRSWAEMDSHNVREKAPKSGDHEKRHRTGGVIKTKAGKILN